MGPFDTFPHVVIFQFPIFPPPSHAPLSWLGAKASDLLERRHRAWRVDVETLPQPPRACSADRRAFLEPLNGRGKGQATVGTGAFGRCVQGEPRDFPSGSLSASLQPSSHHSLPDGRHLSAAWRFALEMVLVRPLK